MRPRIAFLASFYKNTFQKTKQACFWNWHTLLKELEGVVGRCWFGF